MPEVPAGVSRVPGAAATIPFYGQAHIAGLEPGTRIRLRGMAGIGDDGRPAMISPACELLRQPGPSRGGRAADILEVR